MSEKPILTRDEIRAIFMAIGKYRSDVIREIRESAESPCDSPG